MGAKFSDKKKLSGLLYENENLKVKISLPTVPSFPVNMYKIEDRFELDLKRNVLCHCSKWSTVLQYLYKFFEKSNFEHIWSASILSQKWANLDRY